VAFEYGLVTYPETPGMFFTIDREDYDVDYEDVIYTDWHDEYLTYHVADHIMDMYGDDADINALAN
jgi:hypothetical protein